MNDPGMSNVATSLFYLASITQDRNTDFVVAVGELPPPPLSYRPSAFYHQYTSGPWTFCISSASVTLEIQGFSSFLFWSACLGFLVHPHLVRAVVSELFQINMSPFSTRALILVHSSFVSWFSQVKKNTLNSPWHNSVFGFCCGSSSFE